MKTRIDKPVSSKAHRSHLYGRSPIRLLKDLRLHYALASSSLMLFGFFRNNFKGFDGQYVVLIMSIFFANVFGYVVNDFYDSVHDVKEDVKKTRNLFCSSNTKRLGKAVLFISLSFSLLFSAVVSPNIFLIIVLFDSLAFFYSAPPIKLRNRLYWDWIFVFLWKGIIIFTGYFYFSGMILPRDPFMVGATVMVLLLSLINQIDNQIRDFEVDKITNADNSVQRLGSHNASYINRVLLALFYTFSFVFCYFLGLYVTMLLILLNVSLYYFIHPSKYGYIIEFTTISIGVLFLEHFMAFFSYPQQLFFSFWIAVIGGVCIRHVTPLKLFKLAS